MLEAIAVKNYMTILVLFAATGCATAQYNYSNHFAFAPPAGLTASEVSALQAECGQAEAKANEKGIYALMFAGDKNAQAQIERMRMERHLKPCLEEKGFMTTRMNEAQIAIYSALEGETQNEFARQVAKFWEARLGPDQDDAYAVHPRIIYKQENVPFDTYFKDEKECKAYAQRQRYKAGKAAHKEYLSYGQNAMNAGYARASARQRSEISCFTDRGYKVDLVAAHQLQELRSIPEDADENLRLEMIHKFATETS